MADNPWDFLTYGFTNPWATTTSTTGTYTPTVSYVPGTDVQKAPGFNNPYNPYDTGRSNERNQGEARAAGYAAEPVPWWDYDLGKPMPGVGLGPDGYYIGSSGGSGGGGGATGSGSFYDPILSQLKADLNAQGVSDLASRDQAIKQSIGLFGEAPDFGQQGSTLGFNLGSLIDDQTRQIADQNTQAGTSIKARLSKAHEDAVRQITNALAARGALRSGESGFQLGEEQQRYTNANFDARQALLEMLQGFQRGYLEGERARQSQYFQALMAGAGRAQYGGYGGAGGNAPRMAGGTTQHGVLQIPEGGTFDPYGTFGDPTAAATAWANAAGYGPGQAEQELENRRRVGGVQY